MNKSAVSTALVFVMSLMVVALAGCQPAADTNRNASAPAAAVATPTIDRAAIEADVLRVERDWMKAGETYDVEAIKRIVADDATLVYPDGTAGTKADEIRIAEAKAITATVVLTLPDFPSAARSVHPPSLRATQSPASCRCVERKGR